MWSCSKRRGILTRFPTEGKKILLSVKSRDGLSYTRTATLVENSRSNQVCERTHSNILVVFCLCNTICAEVEADLLVSQEAGKLATGTRQRTSSSTNRKSPVEAWWIERSNGRSLSMRSVRFRVLLRNLQILTVHGCSV